eukprot:CAMPEP_0115855898 /NCGR_PEP_ID=MMETSP0287-20121206/14777_1 /TAXON_ID=412157 /ORGANISM="Chrysochromulina rotalis, Strain UIO044" /LENGTH=69 /DNA_ID=CAMNT_0003310061 /DNA_START=104 /DNA_END=314 /DNA_ORIENTATION=+
MKRNRIFFHAQAQDKSSDIYQLTTATCKLQLLTLGSQQPDGFIGVITRQADAVTRAYKMPWLQFRVHAS